LLPGSFSFAWTTTCGPRAALGKRIDVSEATVQRWEAGKAPPPDGWEIRRLCEEFGLEPDELIFPREVTAIERQLMRRAAKQIRRSIDQASEDE
jgi:transcriptional regulator with XRE-family HTH domain